ncbi:hypothetical protein AAFF_G00183330 [Aldrovandia affinis]|uniref:Uncharacterized protein n=1 Tax=Aldrovandia affinis TaxID=143900 RepID=A0AAD7RJZ9_9TELE|nr:hypothetical protein AAFF_G00183330 [Aldrovandia affinis]
MGRRFAHEMDRGEPHGRARTAELGLAAARLQEASSSQTKDPSRLQSWRPVSWEGKEEGGREGLRKEALRERGWGPTLQQRRVAWPPRQTPLIREERCSGPREGAAV